MILLLRFMNQEYVEGFLKGNIFMRSNGYFIDLENESNIKGIGDKFEGAFLESFSPEEHEMFVVLENGVKVPIDFARLEISEHFENIKKFPILCNTMLDSNDFEIVDANNLAIKREVLQELEKDFKDKSCIFISDFFEFKNRIDKELNRLGLKGKMGPIHYFGSKHPLSREEFEEDPGRALFYKRDFFEYQREYRLVVEQIEKDEIILEIGDISDIAFEVSSADLDKLLIQKK